jgi:histidyl-tRNA synthetase
MIKSIKGTRDILPPESALWTRVENTAREIFDLYGFAEVRTPIFESTELFARGVGEDTDIVSKEMYTFEDRDEKSLTLRPEGTAPVVRAHIEHQLQQESPIANLY